MQRKILVGTIDGLHELGDNGRVQMAGHEIKSLALGDSGWWAVLDEGEVWRSADGGDWGEVTALEGLRANCVLPATGGPFVGSSEAHLFALRGEALERVESFEQTRERDTWHTPWGGPPDVRSMSADLSGVVYANVHVGGIVRSADGGASWQPTIDIASDVHQVLSDPGSGTVLGATAWGLSVSGDDGESWRFDTDGLHAVYSRAVAVANETVLISASTGPRTDRAGRLSEAAGRRRAVPAVSRETARMVLGQHRLSLPGGVRIHGGLRHLRRLGVPVLGRGRQLERGGRRPAVHSVCGPSLTRNRGISVL